MTVIQMITLNSVSDVAENAGTESGLNDAVFRCAHVLLRRVFRILRGCGFSEVELRAMAETAVSEIEKIPDSQRSRVTARQAMMCCDVVLKWRRDCDFLDGDGAPRMLSMNGESQSFASLVRLSAPGEDPQTMFATLSELGVVRMTDDKLIELISESVVTCSGQDGLAVAGECVLEHICGFLGSVEFNVFDKPSRSKGRFERACYATVPIELVPVIQHLVSSRGQDFVDVIDEWLARRCVKPTDAGSNESGPSLLVGAGAYLFVRENFT
jgi:acetolactate synthase regulatory subunit